MLIEDFLKKLNLEQYLKVFEEKGIDDIETLRLYSEKELIKFEVKDGHIKKIENALKNLDNHPKEVSPSSSIPYPENLYPNSMVTYLAHPWKEYVEETHFSVKLHWLIDASETVVRFICALLLAEIKEINDQIIPENIQKKFKENISRPTLGVWLNIVKELSEIKIENINIKNLFSFYNDVLNKDGLFPDNGDEKTSLLKLRNRVAHGGGLSQSQSKIYLDIYEPHLITLLESVNNLMNECKLYGVFENRCYLLDGLKPIVVENSTLVSGPFIKINDKNLSLWPLVEFDRIRQTNNDGTIKELSVTPQTYLRVDKLGVQYVPIGVDESYSITNKQEEFENIFGLNKKNENASKVKNYEYTYKDFLVEAKYLKEELIGRVEEIKSIKDWIKNVDAFSDDKCRLIYGGPGLGKSMIMASVVSDILNDLNHHTFYYRFRGGDGRNSKFWFLKLLNDSLYSWDKLREIYPDEAVKSSNSDDLFKDIIKRIEKIKDLEPIQKKIGKDSYEDLKPTLRLFIDGLDEITAQDSSILSVIELLQKDGVLTLIASRLENTVSNLKDLSWIKSFVFKDGFEGLPPMSNNDIRAMLIEGISKSQKKELIIKDEENKENGEILENEIVKAIEKKANGLPLYIYLLIEDINKKTYSISEINELPDGLTNYYIKLVNKIGINDIQGYLSKVIALLSLTTEPLDVKSLSLALVNDFTRTKEDLIIKVIQVAGTLLKQVNIYEGTPCYTLYHQSFRDFILKADTDSTHSLFITLGDMKEALYLKSKMWQELPPSNFKKHIFRAGNYYTLWWQNNGVKLVKDRLMNLEYLLNRTKSLKVEDLNLLMDEYELIETKLEKEELKEFRIWSSFFREKMHLINKIDEELWRPYKTLFQLAYEDGDDSPLTIQAEKLIKEKIEFDGLKLVNRPKNFTRTGLLKVLKGHSGSINGVEILDEGRILSYSYDNTLRLWDNNGNFLEELKGHSGSINGVEILDEGRILSYSYDNTLRLWDNNGKFLEELKGHSNSINGVEILDDGKILSYSDDNTLRLWDNNGKFLEELKGHSNSINGVEILDDGKILSYSDDNTLRLWDKNGKFLEELKGHSGPVKGVKILEDGRILSYSILDICEHSDDDMINEVEILDNEIILSSSSDKTFEYPDYGVSNLKLWDKNGIFLEELKGHSNSINGVEILDDGKILSYSDDNTLRLWDKNGKFLEELKGHSGPVKGVKILDDGRILSYSSEFPANSDDTILRLWDKNGKFLEELKGHSDSISGVKILDDGRIVSYSYDNSLRLWDKNGKFLEELKGHRDYVYGVKILKDGRILSYSNDNIFEHIFDNTIRLWDSEGNELKVLEGHTDSIKGVEILEDERILSYSKDKTLRLWDCKDNELKILKEYDWFRLQILDDGKILDYSDEKTLKLWDYEENEVKTLEGHRGSINGVKILDDGRILSYSKDKTLRLWDNNGNFLKELKGHRGSINGVKILGDGRILSYSKDKTLRLWDNNGNFLKELKGHRDLINGVKILEDGKILSYSDDTLRLWDKEGNFLKELEKYTYGKSNVEILNDGKILTHSKYFSPYLCDNNRNFLKELNFSVNGVEILEDGRILSYSNDDTFRLWDSEGNLLKVIDVDNYFDSVKFLNNGKILIYSNGGTPKLLDNNGNFLKGLGGDIYGDGGVEILNDEKILIYSKYSTPQLLDKDGNFLKKLNFSIKGVKILPDRRILSYGDKTLRLWDKDGNFFKELKGHNNSINGVEILANGRILSYSYIDKTIRIWNSQGEIVKVLYNAVDKDINGYKIGKYKNIIATDGNIFIY